LKELILIDEKTGTVINFIGSRLIYDVFENINDKNKIENILFQSIYHISKLHYFNMFHGDIKPANIFYPNNNLTPYSATSDSGSVV
jgi:hypothetical protein